MKLKIIDGWQPKGVINLSVHGGCLLYCPPGGGGGGLFSLPQVDKVKIKSVELLDWNVKHDQSFSGAMVTGALGGALFGLPGIVAGTMLGGHNFEEEVCFRVEFEDGRNFTAISDEATYEMFEDAALENDNEWENDNE